jgi:hypothetical protein
MERRRGRGRGGCIYSIFFSERFFLCVGGRDTKFQWGEDIVLLREHFLSLGVLFFAYMGREFAA